MDYRINQAGFSQIPPLSRKRKRMARSAGVAKRRCTRIPAIAHQIWVSHPSGGQVPQDRLLNVISLSSQMMAEGWEYRLWTNKKIVVFRSLDRLVLGGESKYRGLGLEASRSIKVYEDKEVFPFLQSINKDLYRESSRRGEFPELLPMHEKRFSPNLLVNYLLDSIGEYNYAVKADNLRPAILHEFGGVYLDTDTQLPGFLEEGRQINGRKLFPRLRSYDGIILVEGWCTGCNNDVIAAVKEAPQMKYILQDQYLHRNMLKNQIYTVYRRRNVEYVGPYPRPYMFWERCAVAYSFKKEKCRLTMKSYKGMYPDSRLAESCITLDDMMRYRGNAIDQRVYGAFPATQIGYGLKCQESERFFNECTYSLRYSLTLHSTGPLPLHRLLKDKYSKLKNQQKSKYRSMFFTLHSDPQGSKESERGFLLSQMVWGSLKRWTGADWDQSVVNRISAHESYQALELLVSSGL
ncbi:glycosyltransferase [Kistimonas scapharcae]|uniref:glycosyltransferase n=1 Tax=Kistimonas scapharcae TaxID=1036133 RepID=UPI0031E7B65A